MSFTQLFVFKLACPSILNTHRSMVLVWPFRWQDNLEMGSNGFFWNQLRKVLSKRTCEVSLQKFVIRFEFGPSYRHRMVRIDIGECDRSFAELSPKLEDSFQMFRFAPTLGEESAEEEGSVDGIEPRNGGRHLAGDTRSNFCIGKEKN